MKKMIATAVASTLGLSTAAFAQPVPPTEDEDRKAVLGLNLGTLTPTNGGAIVAAAIALGVVLGDSNNGTTTTTTSSGR